MFCNCWHYTFESFIVTLLGVQYVAPGPATSAGPATLRYDVVFQPKTNLIVHYCFPRFIHHWLTLFPAGKLQHNDKWLDSGHDCTMGHILNFFFSKTKWTNLHPYFTTVYQPQSNTLQCGTYQHILGLPRLLPNRSPVAWAPNE